MEKAHILIIPRPPFDYLCDSSNASYHYSYAWYLQPTDPSRAGR